MAVSIRLVGSNSGNRNQGPGITTTGQRSTPVTGPLSINTSSRSSSNSSPASISISNPTEQLKISGGSSSSGSSSSNRALTGTEQVQSSFQKYFHRDAGETGLNYWVPEWESNKAKAIAGGMSEADAAASATAKLEHNLGLSNERFDVISDDSFDRTSLGIPSNFTFHDENVGLGQRTTDWATDVVSSNVTNYMSDLNDQYGIQQGNVVGTEGLDWWGYQMTQNIQSHLAQGDDYDTAYAKSMQTVERDIGANTGAINYDKYGSIGYGNPVDTITGYNDRGEPIFNQSYLQLSDLADRNKVGTKSATQYLMNEEGEFIIDDDGNQIATGNTATPFQWKLVADDSAPGGYRHVPVGANTEEGTLSIDGQNFIMDNYVNNDGESTFLYNTGLSNVGVDKFTDGTLEFAPWNVTPAGVQDIANNDFSIKNKNFRDLDGDGKLDYVASNFDHTKYDSNLGLGPNGVLKVDWGRGYLTGHTQGEPFVPTQTKVNPNQSMMIGGGGGNTIVNLDMNQKSTTAADQARKQDERGQASGQRKKGFANKIKPTGNIQQLGIAGGRQSSIPAV